MALRPVPLLSIVLALLACTNAATDVADVILVHGAWADASSWSAVIGILQKSGLNVHAPQLYLSNVPDDVAVVKRAIAAVGGPVVVVGHSVGGFIATLATAGEPNVTAIVYIAAYAPDKGETVFSLASKFGPPAFAEYLVFDKLGFSTIATDGYVKSFASGVKPAAAKILAVVQKPTAATVFEFNATAPGWRTIPSYFQVSTKDMAISPELQAFEAKRMSAVETLKIGTGHLSLITHPKEVAALVMRACTAGVQRKVAQHRLRR